MLKNLQYGLGFLIGLFGALIVCIGAVVGVEILLERALPLKVPFSILVSIGVGVVVSRWIGRMNLARFIAREPKPKAPPQPRPRQERRPWSFHLVGTLISFWAASLIGIIILFGPFGYADNMTTGIRLLKILVCTVAIAGLGGFLLRKEFAKLMSRSAK